MGRSIRRGRMKKEELDINIDDWEDLLIFDDEEEDYEEEKAEQLRLF